MKLYRHTTCLLNKPPEGCPTDRVQYFFVEKLTYNARIEDVLVRSEDVAPLVWACVPDVTDPFAERILAVVEDGGTVRYHWRYVGLVKMGFKYKAVYEIPAEAP